MRHVFIDWPQAVGVLASAILTACATTSGKPADSAQVVPPAPTSSGKSTELYPSTYTVPATPPTLIRHATVLTGTGTRLDEADVLVVNGKIQSVGSNLQAPPQARII